jgi:hypothetical protein
LPIYENPDHISKFLSNNCIIEESSLDDQLTDGSDFEKSLSDNDNENDASAIDVEMDLSP